MYCRSNGPACAGHSCNGESSKIHSGLKCTRVFCFSLTQMLERKHHSYFRYGLVSHLCGVITHFPHTVTQRFFLSSLKRRKCLLMYWTGFIFYGSHLSFAFICWCCFCEFLCVGTSPCARVLKCLIPATVVPQEAVVRAVAWLSVGKIPISTQVSTNDFICP